MRRSSTGAGDAGGGSSGFGPALEVAAEPKALMGVCKLTVLCCSRYAVKRLDHLLIATYSRWAFGLCLHELVQIWRHLCWHH
jgi:hypothetical protein